MTKSRDDKRDMFELRRSPRTKKWFWVDARFYPAARRGGSHESSEAARAWLVEFLKKDEKSEAKARASAAESRRRVLHELAGAAHGGDTRGCLAAAHRADGASADDDTKARAAKIDAVLAAIVPGAQALYRQLQAWGALMDALVDHADRDARDRIRQEVRPLVEAAGKLEDWSASYAGDVRSKLTLEAVKQGREEPNR